MILLVFFPINAKGSELTTINTFFPWKEQTDKTLQVSIVKETPLSADQLEKVKNAITGYGTIKFDDTTTYVSWNEALNTASEYDTKTAMPKIEMISENNKNADIVILVTDAKNADGYSGYTTHVLEDSKIVRSEITIYDINNISGEQISSITRHEFGHALGLVHADSPNDLMYNIVQVPSYVTDCDIASLILLYDGNVQSASLCGV
ncbi:MAG: matrixin family metalloprotease [Nitrosopumilaceae archaeon]